MITVSSKLSNDQVTCKEKEIVLSGKPKFLKGTIQFENNSKEQVFIQDLEVKQKGKSLASLANETIQINSLLAPQESRSQFTSLSLDPTTPPGIYESAVVVGGEKRKLKLIVQENLEIKLTPNRMTFFGLSPGKVHQKEILLVNNGNVPVTIPNVKHNTMVDMDLICRNLSQSIREAGDEGTEATLDHFIKGIKNDLTDWVDIKIDEAGEVIQPGESKFIHFSLTLPKDVSEQRFYEGDVRFIDKKIKYRISNDDGNSQTGKAKRKSK